LLSGHFFLLVLEDIAQISMKAAFGQVRRKPPIPRGSLDPVANGPTSDIGPDQNLRPIVDHFLLAARSQSARL
jgi:hypothetical protein